MSQMRQMLLEWLKASYTASYDVQPVDDGSDLKALCAYHQRDSKYVLVRKAELWGAERHEYLYLWSLERLTVAAAEEIFRHVLADGEPRVKPHSQHMCTYLTALVLYDSADPEALVRLRQLNRHRSYKLSLHGWMEFRVAAVDAATGAMTANRGGRILVKELSRLVHRVIEKHTGEENKQ